MNLVNPISGEVEGLEMDHPGQDIRVQGADPVARKIQQAQVRVTCPQVQVG